MIGLYQKAIELLNKEIESRASSFDFDESSGITKEDQKDILEQIEKITSENKISVTEEIFDIKSEKKDVFLPFLINILAAVILGGFILFQYFSFTKTTLELTTEQDISGVDQGKLLEEVQREQEEELRRKEQEINGIQNELAGINAEREDLIANMDLRVQEKADELRRQLEAALEEERSRLQNEGVSEDEIQRRLSQLEQQKESESNQEIASFRDELDKQRLLYEQLQDELEQELSTANQDMASLEQEYQRRTEELEQARSEAEKELMLLSEQNKQEEIVSAQLIGFYNSVEDNMNEGRLNEALTGLDTIKSFMNDKAVLALPEISKRRDVEFFVVGSLESLIKSELNKTSVDTTSLVAAANLITSIREKVLSADQAYNSGNLNRAEQLYNEAVAILPEIKKSHDFLVTQAANENSTRLTELERLLNNARTSFEQNNLNQSKNYYIEALKLIPISQTRINTMISNIESMGFKNEVSRLTVSQTEQAEALLEEADGYYEDENYNKAIPVYVSLIAQFPYSAQANDSITGIASSLEGLRVSSYITTAEDSDIIQSMQEDLNEKIAEIKILEAEKAAVEAELGPLKAELDRLKEELEELRNNPAIIIMETDNNSSTEDNSQANNQNNTQTPLPDNLEGYDIEKLLSIEKEYNSLKQLYIDYITKEDAVLKERGDEGLVQAKIYLDIFLASRNIENIFDGLRDRIKMYDIAFERVGRQDALLDARDIIYDLSLYRDKDDKLDFLNTELRKNSDDDAFTDLLLELKAYVEEN